MKQHITVEQLNEVNTIDLIRVLKHTLAGDERWAESITIGKMIEILNQNFNWFRIEKEHNDEDRTVFWVNIGPTREYANYKLVDVLWEAVKDLIEGCE
jgi:hypothetical protein